MGWFEIQDEQDGEGAGGPQAVRRSFTGIRGQHPDPQRRPEGRGPGGRVHLGGHWVHGHLEQRRRVAEKQKAVAKEKKNAEKFGDILAYWKEKYGYSKYYPGSWFYYDQLSTDPDENGRGQINTPANRQMSGFRMRKGGFYLDGM